MTGGEIVAAGKAVEAIGKRTLGEDAETKDLLLRVAEGTPEMTAAARSMAARTAVKERVKLKLYQPFARMLGVSKAYFEDTFPEEMAAKIADIPEENLVTPPASVAVPTLQGLSYTFEEPSLKELYLNLLKAASDDRQADHVHPAFAEIIKQLSAVETRALSAMLLRGAAIVRLKQRSGDSTEGFLVLMTHLLPFVDSATGRLKEESRMPTWVDNWQRLGLITVTYDEYSASEDSYKWVSDTLEYQRFSAALPDGKTIEIEKGLVRPMSLGKIFHQIVS